jgi:hypothetical protein
MGQSTKYGVLTVLALTGTLAGGCDPATYTDIHFGTNLGADYVAPAPARDAGDDAAAAAAPGGASGSVDGTGGTDGGT